MKLAVPVWNGRVSPVFDSATTLLVLEVEAGQETGRITLDLGSAQGGNRVARVLESGTEVLLCGAIWRPWQDLLASKGIKVMAFLTGPVEQVVQAFLAGHLDETRFRMPGCRRGRGRGRGRRRGLPGGGKRCG